MTPEPHHTLKLRSPDTATLAKGFPTKKIAVGSRYYRSFTKGKGPWYFNPTNAFRFNIPTPDGTCYLATDILTAILERLGEHLADGPIPREDVDKMQVAELELQATVIAALTGHKKAALYGCHREICTTDDYSLTQEWARAFRRLPVDAISYESRLTSESTMNALALFGPEGDAGNSVKTLISGREALRRAGMGHLVAPSRPKGKTMKAHLAPDPRRRP
jgi:RES domain